MTATERIDLAKLHIELNHDTRYDASPGQCDTLKYLLIHLGEWTNNPTGPHASYHWEKACRYQASWLKWWLDMGDDLSSSVFTWDSEFSLAEYCAKYGPLSPGRLTS
jgi:hypothetical protein